MSPDRRLSFEHQASDNTILLGSIPILRENTLKVVGGLPHHFPFHQPHERTYDSTAIKSTSNARIHRLPDPAMKPGVKTLTKSQNDSSSDPSNAVMDMNYLKPTPPKIARPLKETLAMFRKCAKTPTAPSAAARAAACIEEHRMKIKYMEMDEERKNEEHQLRMEQLRIKIAHAKEKIEAQKILVTTLKGSPKIYLQNTE
ncbi:hypothetical protein TNCV_341821 [Trichonephila clavipes]|nr:hypothetical protein TNCV_341821 [Trichonephila clavipes]